MLYAGIVIVIFALELLIKGIVEKRGKTGVTKAVCNGKILIRKHHNKGFMLNIGQKKQKVVAATSFVLCILLTGFMFFCGGRYNGMIKSGLSMVLGGAYSNTYDRLFRKYVVDYFSIGAKGTELRRVIFNIADMCIMIGTLLVIIGGLGDENIGKGKICGESYGGPGGSQ